MFPTTIITTIITAVMTAIITAIMLQMFIKEIRNISFYMSREKKAIRKN